MHQELKATSDFLEVNFLHYRKVHGEKFDGFVSISFSLGLDIFF